jgi:hypothetical protein
MLTQSRRREQDNSLSHGVNMRAAHDADADPQLHPSDIMQGWLTKKGMQKNSKIATWKRRFCLFNPTSQVFAYYSDDSRRHEKGHINVCGFYLLPDRKGTRKNRFDLALGPIMDKTQTHKDFNNSLPPTNSNNTMDPCCLSGMDTQILCLCAPSKVACEAWGAALRRALPELCLDQVSAVATTITCQGMM